MSTVIETQFPKNVATVGNATEYLLERSNYQFIHTEDTAATLALELLAVHRSLGPLPLRTAIGTIVEPA